MMDFGVSNEPSFNFQFLVVFSFEAKEGTKRENLNGLANM